MKVSNLVFSSEIYSSRRFFRDTLKRNQKIWILISTSNFFFTKIRFCIFKNPNFDFFLLILVHRVHTQIWPRVSGFIIFNKYPYIFTFFVCLWLSFFQEHVLYRYLLFFSPQNRSSSRQKKKKKKKHYLPDKLIINSPTNKSAK